MSRDLDLLVPEFREKLEIVLSECEKSGYPMVPFFTIRTPFEQAKLWRQSRSSVEISDKIQELKLEGCDFLAHCIDVVGPQNGHPVTNAIPGLSWHQWRAATDSYWSIDGKAEWSTARLHNGKNGYHVYADIAVTHGLTAGGHWHSIKDWPHVQLQKESSPEKLYSMIEIDHEMKRMYGNDPK